MAYKTRHANLFDLLSISSTRSKQRVLRLNPPYTLVQPEALLTDLLRSQLPFRPRFNFVYVYRDTGRIQGWVQARRRWQSRDEWTITILATADKAPAHIGERLIEEVVREAGERESSAYSPKSPTESDSLTHSAPLASPITPTKKFGATSISAHPAR